MSVATSRAAYKRHAYSGRRKSLKRVQGGLRRYYVEESRVKAWRSQETKKKPVNEEIVVDNSIIIQNTEPRTYARVKPKIGLKATYNAPSTSTVTAEPVVEPLEIKSKDIGNMKQECKEYNKYTEMAFSEICRICLCVNVRMFVLKKTGLQNLYKTLTNSFMDENEGPIIVCYICHARLIHCRRLQQQAIESNAVLEQLLAGGSMSIPKPHEARDEIQFTPTYHLDIRPVDCDIENDCKDEIFSLDSVKVEEENFENENSKFEENGNHVTEQYITSINNFSQLSEMEIKSNSTDSNINVVRKENLDFEGPTIKSNPKVKKDNQPINKTGKHPAKIMKKNFLKQKSVNILTKKTSGASTKYIFGCDGCSKIFSTKDILAKHISYSHNTQKNSDPAAVRIQVEQTPVPQETEIYNYDIYLKAQMYCCNNCEYKCIKKYELQRHMKIHTTEKHFSCNICEYRCITKSYLQRHMKIHTGEKPFSCNICEYRCYLKSNLQTHMKIHTGEKPYSCHICEYSCIRKIDLQRHIKIHTGEKPFSCNMCEYRCITKSDLQRHRKIHIGEKPFS